MVRYRACFVRVKEKCELEVKVTTVTTGERSDQSKDDFLLSYHQQLSACIITLIKSLLHSENACFDMHVVTFSLRDRYAASLSLSYLLNTRQASLFLQPALTLS